MEELYQFFASNFHQDWVLLSRNPDDVIDAYIAERHSRAGLERLSVLIEGFAAERPDGALEDSLHRELGCFYDPTFDGSSARVWLHHVAGRLRRGASVER